MIPPPLVFQVSIAAGSTSLSSLLVAAHELSASGQNWTAQTRVVLPHYSHDDGSYEGFHLGSENNVQLDDTLLLIEPEAAKQYEATQSKPKEEGAPPEPRITGTEKRGPERPPENGGSEEHTS